MKRYFAYLKRVVVHKYYVFLVSIRLGIPILGLLHDLSKFSKSEFIQYAKFFYNDKGVIKDNVYNDEYYDVFRKDVEFQKAWLHHQKSNKHHWNYWVIVDDYGCIYPIEILEKYIKEMIADWIGANRVKSNYPSVIKWYEDHKPKMIMHKNSEILLESILYTIQY